eukprot:1888095-Alexandrium_andersonii.AAC.1
MVQARGTKRADTTTAIREINTVWDATRRCVSNDRKVIARVSILLLQPRDTPDQAAFNMMCPWRWARTRAGSTDHRDEEQRQEQRAKL